MRSSRVALLALTFMLAVGLHACAPARPTETLDVLAGSEVKDIEPLLADLEKATGVHVNLTYSGTLAGIDRIESGAVTPDAAWFSKDTYFVLTDTKHRIKQSEKIMITPVVLGVKKSKAAELGWSSGAASWKDIEQAIGAGRLHYAMTNPSTSNSGFAAVIAVSSAYGSGDALKASDVDQARLTTFFSGQKLLSGSSGWLADAYVAGQSGLDGMINYESVLLTLNAGTTLSEPFTILYPRDGTVIADYPLDLLNQDKQSAYRKVVDYLRAPDAQAWIVKNTHRRPVTAGVALPAGLNPALLVDTPFPSSRSAVDAILLGYLNKHRPPAHAIFVVDTTGSMQQTDGTGTSRLERARQALDVLAGADDSITGRFARFDDRELVTILTFSDHVEQRKTYQMTRADDQAVFANVRAFAASLRPSGATAIYDALESALDVAAADTSNRYDSIILLTDGENNRGEKAEEFERRYAARAKKVRIFPIFIGEASPAELERIADQTGGKAFDARKEALPDIFKDVRGYQ